MAFPDPLEKPPSWRLRVFADQQFPALLSLVLPASPQLLLMNVDDNTDTYFKPCETAHQVLATKGTFTFLPGR